MKSAPQIIDQLNIILKNELTAVNQYLLHARMLQDWGINKLGAKVYDESQGETKHADWVINRILVLEGAPNVQDLGKIVTGKTVPEMFKADIALEMTNQSCLKTAIAVCEVQHDYVTREIFTRILDDTEEHIDWIETQQHLINTVGLEFYIQDQIGDISQED